MGFTVSEEIKFQSYGVAVSGCYVTIKATYNHHKQGAPNNVMGMPMMNGVDPVNPYTLSCTYYIYAENDSNLQPLQQSVFSISLPTAPENPLLELYTQLKGDKFAGKTLTDNL